MKAKFSLLPSQEPEALELHPISESVVHKYSIDTNLRLLYGVLPSGFLTECSKFCLPLPRPMFEDVTVTKMFSKSTSSFRNCSCYLLSFRLKHLDQQFVFHHPYPAERKKGAF